MTEPQNGREKFETFKKEIAEKAGEATVKIGYAAITFETQELQPFADFGQGWEGPI